MTRELTEICKQLNIVSRRGKGNATVSGLSYDGFTAKQGDLFLAVEGVYVDRHELIPSVLERGGEAIIHSRQLDDYRPDVAYVQVPNVQRAMSPISSSFFGDPSAGIFVIGVTGTNGKSTTSWFIYQLLKALGMKAGLLSSVYHDFGSGLKENRLHQSTPEAPIIQKNLWESANAGVEYMVIEATSHGLSDRNNRVGDVRFDAAVLTNVTHEHLEFHGNMERYVNDKANLFRLMALHGGDRAFGVVNRDDPHALIFSKAAQSPDGTQKPVFGYGMDPGSDLQATGIVAQADSSEFLVNWKGESYPTRIPIPGRFNISNALAALLAVSESTTLPMPQIVRQLPYLDAITGRMSAVEAGQPFRVIVDFAHTPDSFEKLLPEMKGNTKGRLITLFGSAGDRDTAKRPIQGEIASRHADIIILADEDPRSEEPASILNDIAAGCAGFEENKNLYLIPDRSTAIAFAIGCARPGDTVLLLGKGHETSIAYADGDVEWNESRIALECLAKHGYGTPATD